MPATHSQGAYVQGLSCIVWLLAAVPAHASTQWVSIKTLSDFADAASQLQALIDAKGHTVENKLCVIGQKDGRYQQAYVYWPSENKLILWTPDVTDPETLVHSRRYLDLTRDVVKGSDVHGSTYLLTQTFVDETLRACATKGDHYTITKTPSHAATHG